MKDVLQRAIDTYGEERQIDKVLEEMSELTKALLKMRYAKPTGVERDILMDAVSEETADVEIMLEQLHMIYQNDKKVEEYKQKKIERLERRLNGYDGV
jgi:hypothetical protein